jgi:hypothetical protein
VRIGVAAGALALRDAAKLTAEAMVRNLIIGEWLGCLAADGVRDMRRGQAAGGRKAQSACPARGRSRRGRPRSARRLRVTLSMALPTRPNAPNQRGSGCSSTSTEQPGASPGSVGSRLAIQFSADSSPCPATCAQFDKTTTVPGGWAARQSMSVGYPLCFPCTPVRTSAALRRLHRAPASHQQLNSQTVTSKLGTAALLPVDTRPDG